jgi:hypothetical protein
MRRYGKPMRIALYAGEAILALIASLGIYFVLFFGLLDYASDDHFVPEYLPAYISVLMPSYLFIVYHLLLHPASYKRKRLTLICNGAVSAFLGLLILVMDIVYLANGTYTSVVMGGATSIYPLDTILASVLAYIPLGVAGIVYGIRLKDEGEGAYEPYTQGAVLHVLSSVFRPFVTIVSFFFLGAFITFETFDFSSGWAWAGMLPLYILMIVPAVFGGLYEFSYRDMEEGSKKDAYALKLSIIGLSVTAVCFIWFEIAKGVNPMLVVEEGAALFPADFMGSLNIGPLLICLCAFCPLAVALVKSLIKRFGKRRAEPAEAKAED